MPHPALRAVVIIPARDEANLLPLALGALQGQVDASGRPLDPRTFEVLVLANNCSDQTAEVARAYACQNADGPPIGVAEVAWPPELAHVGTARRWLMDQAAERLEQVGAGNGLILSTDADTVVAPNWIAAQQAEVARGAEAVAGVITVDSTAWQDLPAATRRAYWRELVHRGRTLQLEALIDPNPLDPPPRHDYHGGASLGITTETYRRVGGLPPLRALEDVALAEALWRIDARFVHSRLVRVQTSLRLDSRAVGGHGWTLARQDSTQVMARPAAVIEAELRLRQALRQLFQQKRSGQRGKIDAATLEPLGLNCELSPDRLAATLNAAATFGRWIEAVRGFGSGPPRPAEVGTPLAVANRDLRQLVRAVRRAAVTGQPEATGDRS